MPTSHWPEPPGEQPDLAVALSGGGHRAAIFGLGVLLYLVDSGLNRRVRLISSVSGGSITNGFVAQECDFRQVDREAFDRIAAALLQRIVRQGLFRWWVIWAYVAVVVGLVVLSATTAVLSWPVALPTWGAALIGLAAAAVALLRGWVLELWLLRGFFSRSGRGTLLGEITRGVEHVFCSTDINSNAPFYFSTWGGGYTYSPALGWARSGDTRLSTAVRASAAFPGGFPPKRLWVDIAKYNHGTHEIVWQLENVGRQVQDDLSGRLIPPYRPRVLFLADGGIWNNLGTQAFLEHNLDRLVGELHAENRWGRPEMRCIVANASAPLRPRKLWRLHMPLLGELAALRRSANILNVNTVAPRAEQFRLLNNFVVVGLTDNWDRALESADFKALQAAHPEEDAKLFDEPVGIKFPREVGEWGIWAELNLYSELGSEGLARLCSSIPTTLGRIPRERAIKLLIHAYQNAQTEVYVQFGYSRVQPRTWVDRFSRLIPPTPWEMAREVTL